MRAITLSTAMAIGCARSVGGGDDETDASTPVVDGCATGATPTLTIGTGDESYEPMGPTVNLVHGPQGGYHVLVALEATHLDTSEFAVALVQGTIGGVVTARTQPWVDFRCNPDTDTLQSWGTLLIYPLQPPELDQQSTTITADVTAIDGVKVSATAVTTIVDPLLE